MVHRRLRRLTFVVDPETGRRYPIPAGGDGTGEDDDAAGEETDPDGDNDDGDEGDGEGGQPSFTQADVDAAIEKRLARERKQWEAKLEDEKKKASLEETERLKLEKDQAEQAAQETTETAKQALVRSKAEVVAVQVGANPERVAQVVKLADLADIDVDDDFTVDAKAVKKAIEQVLSDVPELKASKTASRSGTDGHEFNGSGGDGDQRKEGLKGAIASIVGGDN